MSDPNQEYIAYRNAFRYDDYETFKKVCLNNKHDYSVIRFIDKDVNKKLKRDSEFIEIYRDDIGRTPYLVIESAVKDNEIYTTELGHCLYKDQNFLSKFGLGRLADFATGYLRADILNGCDGLEPTYEFCQDFDIRNEQYRELKKLLLSDTFSIKISEPDNAFAHQQTYQSRVVSEYYRPVFRIITSPTTHNYYINLLACNSRFFDSSTNRVTDKKEKEKVDFIPLLYCQKVLISRLVNHLAEVQKSWSDVDRQRLWALRGIEKGSK